MFPHTNVIPMENKVNKSASHTNWNETKRKKGVWNKWSDWLLKFNVKKMLKIAWEHGERESESDSEWEWLNDDQIKLSIVSQNRFNSNEIRRHNNVWISINVSHKSCAIAHSVATIQQQNTCTYTSRTDRVELKCCAPIHWERST